MYEKYATATNFLSLSTMLKFHWGMSNSPWSANTSSSGPHDIFFSSFFDDNDSSMVCAFRDYTPKTSALKTFLRAIRVWQSLFLGVSATILSCWHVWFGFHNRVGFCWWCNLPIEKSFLGKERAPLPLVLFYCLSTLSASLHIIVGLIGLWL